MRIFVINRKLDTERWKQISAQLDSLNLEYERVEAVDGRCMDDAAKRAIADLPKMRRVLRVLSDGEIGCAASHLAIYRRIVAENIAVACVLEDDARLLDGFERAKMAEFGERARVELLTDKKYGMIWTIGYVINRAGAAAMLKYNMPIWRVADCWESVVRRGKLAVDWSADALVEPDRMLGSVITPEGIPPHQVSLPMDLWSVFKRTIWRLVYGIGLKV